jgi:hypothetical protein
MHWIKWDNKKGDNSQKRNKRKMCRMNRNAWFGFQLEMKSNLNLRKSALWKKS